VKIPSPVFATALALLLFVGPANSEQTFTAPQLRADLAQLRLALRDMPADLAHSTDVPKLNAALDALDGKLADSAPLTRDEAWREFATLNPLLADGHLFIGFVDWRGDTRALLAAGGALFPFDVDVTAGCDLVVHQEPDSAWTFPEAGAPIRAINSVPSREVCEQLMARVHGETPAFRADLLSRRFWFFYWKTFGAPANYELAFDAGIKSYPGRSAVPRLLEDEQVFERQFEIYSLGDKTKKSVDTAVLKLGTFAWPDKARVLAFTQQQFELLNRWHVKNLVIDLTDNGGGNDDQWIEGVMPYVATKRWRVASTYRKRVVSPDPAKHEVMGAVVDGDVDTWYGPQPENPLRFRGSIYVLVGPGTYSSAVLFANVMRDFGFAKLAGTGDAVRADQSGGTRRTTLTHTGLIFVSPRFVLRRPSGKTAPIYLTPSIDLTGTPKERMPAKLGERIGK
jgi:hypothetical protein